MLSEVHRVLKDTGVYICISREVEKKRKKHLKNVAKFNWKVTKTDHRNDSVHESRNIVYWGLDRSVILWRDIASVDGVDTPVSDALIYWSPKTSSIELLQVTDSGEVVRASLAENDEGLFGACETVTGVEDDQAEGPGSFMTVTFETDRAGFTISTWRATEDPERRVAETSIVFEPFE